MKIKPKLRLIAVFISLGLAITVSFPVSANAGKPAKQNPYCLWQQGTFLFSEFDINNGLNRYYYGVRMYLNPGNIPGGTNNVANTLTFTANNGNTDVSSHYNFNKAIDFVTDSSFQVSFLETGLNISSPISQVVIYFDYMGKSGRRIGTSGPINCSQQSW